MWYGFQFLEEGLCLNTSEGFCAENRGDKVKGKMPIGEGHLPVASSPSF